MTTIVSFHAHPDDEALLTGGTLARLAAAGHRVVLVTATAGSLGLSDGAQGDALAARRLAELRRSAAILGCSRVECLEFPDSGWSTQPGFTPASGSFAALPLDGPAQRLAEILREEDADLLTTYDRHGGYGHLDHVRVHDVGRTAARLAGTPRVLQATVDRTVIARGVRVLQLLRLVPQGTATDQVGHWFSARGEITHRIRVRSFARAKKAALACHRSQATGGSGPRTAAILLALPRPLFALVCGTEWFVEAGCAVPEHPITDLLEAAPAVIAA